MIRGRPEATHTSVILGPKAGGVLSKRNLVDGGAMGKLRREADVWASDTERGFISSV